MSEEIIEPKYSFAEVPEGTINPVSPIKKLISKTMEVTENFTMFDVMSYMAKLDKGIKDKEAELEGLYAMKRAYEEELILIEETLGVQKAEEEYQKEVAENLSKDEEDKDIESPYAKEENI